jgi:decaprenylphospho-beta-D-ribofuranose 2-oxidase
VSADGASPRVEAPAWSPATLTTWGRVRHARTETLAAPDDDAALARALGEGGSPLIVYGSGRCYGDAALNDGGRTLVSRARRRILEIDRAACLLVAEAGATFSDLSAALHPLKLTYPVAAATGAVTLGGALANDLHAKNNHSAGSFARHVLWCDLMLADGTVVRVDRTSDPDLFRATAGGMGLTGIILRLALKLVPVKADAVDVRYQRIADLDDFLDRLEEGRDKPPFWFGWVDALATGRHMGRGILETGRYAADATGVVPAPVKRRVPIDLPSAALSPAVIAAYNARRWRRLPAAGLSLKKPMAPFYFPLDHMQDFNRVYGRRGFYSIHVGIPQGDRDGVKAVLSEIVRARAGSIASVLKPMGGPGEGFVSFPMKGYALAVDLPRRPGVEDVHARLERIVLAHGGRLYVAKDSLMSADGYQRMFPALDRFRDVLARVDPKGRFQSDMSRRLRIRPDLA